MSVEQLKLGVSDAVTMGGLRRLGTIGMIGGPMLLVGEIYRRAVLTTGNHDDRVFAVLSIIYIVGWTCSIIGMRRLRVTGQGILSAAVFVLQLIGLAMAGAWAVGLVGGLAADPGSLLFRITDPFWPLSHLFMLVVGCFVLGAGQWRGWRTVPPFLCGMALVALFAAGALGWHEVGLYLFLLLGAAGFTLLGYAVRSSPLPEQPKPKFNGWASLS